jgi:hypothetical protein
VKPNFLYSGKLMSEIESEWNSRRFEFSVDFQKILIPKMWRLMLKWIAGISETKLSNDDDDDWTFWKRRLHYYKKERPDKYSSRLVINVPRSIDFWSWIRGNIMIWKWVTCLLCRVVDIIILFHFFKFLGAFVSTYFIKFRAQCQRVAQDWKFSPVNRKNSKTVTRCLQHVCC